MRVLHVINSLQIGGAEVLLRNLAPEFHRSGVDTEIYLFNSQPSPLIDQLVSEYTTVNLSGQYAVYRPTQVFGLAKHLHSQAYDVIHVHLFPAQLWTPVAVRVAGKATPLVTTEHSTYNRRRKPLFRPLDRWMYGQYQSVACISAATASALTQWLPELATKTALVPNGISLGRFRDAKSFPKEEITGISGCPLILFVARFDSQKDHATVLRALVRVPAAHLILVGDGPLRHDIEGLARALGIVERVHFLGRRQDVPELIKMADVYVHSSHWEGFGMAALEAMAGGLPVVASRVPGLMDVVGDAGLLFEPGDDAALGVLLNDVLTSSQTRSDLAARGEVRAQDYSIEQTAARYVALYRAALSARTQDNP